MWSQKRLKLVSRALSFQILNLPHVVQTSVLCLPIELQTIQETPVILHFPSLVIKQV